jgi:hypothetical protein
MTKFNFFSGVVLGAVALVVAACGPGGGGGDGGDGGVMDVPTARADVPDRDGGGLFARCRTNIECGSGYRCDTAYSGGLCVKTCRRDADCGADGICTTSRNGSVCRPACQPGNDDCAPYSGLCFYFDNSMQDRRACYPSCFEMPPAGVPACTMGTSCNPWDGECQASPRVMGADNGDPCSQSSDCKSGRCILETTDTPMPGTGTGYLGGYCYSVARRPDQAQYMRGMGLLRGNCPAGSVIIPYTGEATGDVSRCVKECRGDMDCRTGYYCNQVFNGTPPMAVYTTGGCVPINCIQMGRSCPAGTRCDRRGSGASAYGVCVQDGDGGTDGGSDASSDAAANADSGDAAMMGNDAASDVSDASDAARPDAFDAGVPGIDL